MTRSVLTCLGLLVLCSPVLADWTSPIPLPADSAGDTAPVAVAVDDSNLVAAWISRYAGSGLQQIRGGFYDSDSGNWQGPMPFSELSPLVADGPGLTVDPMHENLLVSFYQGAFPTDGDTWGIYTATADSVGVSPTHLAVADTSVSTMPMCFNLAGRVGMAWIDETGTDPDAYASVWFSSLAGDTWNWRTLIAAGAGSPANISCFGPAVCPDTGDGFKIAYTRRAVSPPSVRVLVQGYPDTAVLGDFAGTAASICNDLHGTLMLASVVTDSAVLYHFLVLRSYSYQTQTWSAPETLGWDLHPMGGASLCADTLGRCWLAYVENHLWPRLLVRYYDGEWSPPETVCAASFMGPPVIVSAYSNQLWVIWCDAGGGQYRILSARRIDGGTAVDCPTPCGLRLAATATIVRGALFLSRSSSGLRASELLDAAGRRALGLHPGPNDVSALSPGVYFVRAVSRELSAVGREPSSVFKVVLTR